MNEYRGQIIVIAYTIRMDGFVNVTQKIIDQKNIKKHHHDRGKAKAKYGNKLFQSVGKCYSSKVTSPITSDCAIFS